MPQQTPTNEELFKKIKSARTIVTYEPTLFGEPEHLSFPEYWKLVDIRSFVDIKHFPYDMGTKRETAPNWTNVIEILYNFTPENVLNKIQNKYEWENDHIRRGKDQGYELSRYLSWEVMKYSNQYQNTSFQQAYFMSPGKDFPQIEQTATKLERIKIRNRVGELQKQLSGIIHRVKGNYKQIFNSMYTALFQNPTPTSHLGDKPVAEYMSEFLLNTYAQALQNITYRWNKYCSDQNEQYLISIITQEMLNARYSTPGGRPEQYLTKTTVAETFSEIQNMEKEFIEKYSTVQSR